MENQTFMRYIIYRRKSSEDKKKQVLSLPAQKLQLDEVANKASLKVVANLSESASAYKSGRPEFAKAIKIIRDGKANAFLVCHLSRLARNMTEGGMIIDMLKDGTLKEIKTPTETYVKNSSQEFILALHFAMSKKSSDDTSEFVRRDINSKLIKGEYPGFASLGYLNINSEGIISGKQNTLQKQTLIEEIKKIRKIKRIEKDPLLSPLIKKLFELYATGQYTMNRLREMADTWGLFGERSKRKLSKQTIQRILTNPLYYGAILFKGVKYEPEELPCETRHDPIISRELYYKAQEVMTNKGKVIKTKEFYPYSVFLKCGHCGGNISGTTAKKHHYYRCIRCGKNDVREEEVEKQIISHIEKLTVDDDFLNLALEEISEENKNEVLEKNTIINHQQIALKRTDAELDSLMSKYTSPENLDYSIITAEEVKQRKVEILIKREMLRNEIENRHVDKMAWYEQTISYVQFAHNLKEKFIKASPQKKREAFQYIFQNPTLTDRLLLTLYQNPHNSIIKFNLDKQHTLTSFIVLPKTKVEAYASTQSHMRDGRDSDPRPLP